MLYKPPPKDNIPALVEEYLERATFVANDLDWLLALPHDKFWCQVTLFTIPTKTRHMPCRWLGAVVFLPRRCFLFLCFLHWIPKSKLWLELLFRYHHLNDVYTNAFHHGIFRNSCLALGSFMPLWSLGVGWRVCPKPELTGREPRTVHPQALGPQ